MRPVFSRLWFELFCSLIKIEKSKNEKVFLKRTAIDYNPYYFSSVKSNR